MVDSGGDNSEGGNKKRPSPEYSERVAAFEKSRFKQREAVAVRSSPDRFPQSANSQTGTQGHEEDAIFSDNDDGGVNVFELPKVSSVRDDQNAFERLPDQSNGAESEDFVGDLQDESLPYETDLDLKDNLVDSYYPNDNNTCEDDTEDGDADEYEEEEKYDDVEEGEGEDFQMAFEQFPDQSGGVSEEDLIIEDNASDSEYDFEPNETSNSAADEDDGDEILKEPKKKIQQSRVTAVRDFPRWCGRNASPPPLNWESILQESAAKVEPSEEVGQIDVEEDAVEQGSEDSDSDSENIQGTDAAEPKHITSKRPINQILRRV